MTSLCVALAMLSPTVSEAAQKRILVILDTQRVYALEGDKLVFEFRCSTGRKGLETPVSKGEPYKITAKLPVGKALPELGGATIYWQMRVPMFDPKQRRTRRIGFHSSDNVPNYPASSGCIRLQKADAKKLFEWARVGTPVWVHQAVPSC